MPDQLSAKIARHLALIGEDGAVIHEDVLAGLSPKVKLRDYQLAAFRHFLLSRDPDFLARNNIDLPRHVLFHMATGSGKTVVMSMAMIELYRQGYRNFVFFVNGKQIVEKTRENFTVVASPKYLFAPDLKIDSKVVEVRAVTQFADARPDAINILFTTVHGLHLSMTEVRENSVSLSDFQEKPIVLLSDEAHHLNTETKSKLTADEAMDVASWERTVRSIFEAHDQNVLLDFSATVDFDNCAIAEKYDDKILFDYELSKFRSEGWSKDILLRRVGMPFAERMLQACVISQLRRRIAANHRIDLKPVVLMKSGNIDDSKANQTTFEHTLANLTGAKLRALRASGEAANPKDEFLLKAFDTLGDATGSLDNLATELKAEFGTDRCVNVNDNKALEEQQVLLNTLESRGNPVRVIFAVNKLDEGWDVLNLFDIVRLSGKVDGSNRKPGAKTVREAQLIGRGARYMPFRDISSPDMNPAKRKYDSDLDNPLRLLEVMHYHCPDESVYIARLRMALEHTGATESDEKIVALKVKQSFKSSSFYQSQLVFANERQTRPEGDRPTPRAVMTRRHLEFNIGGERAIQVAAFREHEDTDSSRHSDTEITRSLDITMASLGWDVVRTAMDGNRFFRLALLKEKFPKLRSMRDFFQDTDYLGDYHVVVRVPMDWGADRLTAEHKLRIARFVLDNARHDLEANWSDYVGTAFKGRKISDVVVDRAIKLSGSADAETLKGWSDSDLLAGIDPQTADWYVYSDCFGTSEEKKFVRFIADRVDKIREAYDEFWLVRNQKIVKAYREADGRGIEPDYLLFLRRKGDAAEVVSQVFVEPKGGHLAPHDEWKDHYLSDLAWECPVDNVLYRIVGLPLFNSEKVAGNDDFRRSFDDLMLLDGSPLS